MRRFVLDMYSSRAPVWSMPAEHVERVRAALGDGWELVALREEVDGSGDGRARVSEPLRAAIADAEVYCGFGIARDAFRAAHRLRWVHSGAAGVGASLFPEMVESEVVLTNSAGVHAPAVAEHVLAMMLHFARGLDLAQTARRERRWMKDELQAEGSPVTELADATVVVVGFGGLGRAVGRRCRALGMRVVGVRRHAAAAGDDPDAHRVVPTDGLDDALDEADYVVLAVPHTAQTDGLFDAARIARLKPGAVLVNVCRGSVVDEDALLAALRAGRLRGAALDVFREEPLSPQHPFWDEPRVCVTPHTASVTPRFWDREAELVCENVARYRAGRPLRNVVDKRAGY